MTIIAGITVLALIGVLFLNQRHYQARIDRLLNVIITERASAEHRTTELLAHHANPNPDTTALIALVERMAQRIQAPEQAITDHAIGQAGTIPPEAVPVAVNAELDADYWNKLPSKEDLAEHAMTEELSAA